MSGQRNTAHTHSQPAEKPGCTSTHSATAIPDAPSATNTSAPSTPATPAKSDRRRAEIIAAARDLYE